jgi:hypothetical protein
MGEGGGRWGDRPTDRKAEPREARGEKGAEREAMEKERRRAEERERGP